EPIRVTRETPAANLPAQLLSLVFNQGRPAEGQPSLDTVVMADGDYVVYALYDVIPGTLAGADPAEAEEERAYLDEQVGLQDFTLYLRALQRNADIERPAQ